MLLLLSIPGCIYDSEGGGEILKGESKQRGDGPYG